MPRDATETRLALIRAGEHLFARQGVDGARTADIRRAAGQQNESALHYHFGSRQGLLLAIFRKHIEGTEPERRLLLLAVPSGRTRIRELVSVLVRPDAGCLHTEDGRDYLRIIAQIAGMAGIQRGPAQLPLEGTALGSALDELVSEAARWAPEPVARERVAAVVGFLTFALADRARRTEAEETPLPSHEEFMTDLTKMLVAALCAEPEPHRSDAAQASSGQETHG